MITHIAGHEGVGTVVAGTSTHPPMLGSVLGVASKIDKVIVGGDVPVDMLNSRVGVSYVPTLAHGQHYIDKEIAGSTELVENARRVS